VRGRYRVLWSPTTASGLFPLWRLGCCFLTHETGEPLTPPPLFLSCVLCTSNWKRRPAYLVTARPMHTYTRRNHKRRRHQRRIYWWAAMGWATTLSAVRPLAAMSLWARKPVEASIEGWLALAAASRSITSTRPTRRCWSLVWGMGLSILLNYVLKMMIGRSRAMVYAPGFAWWAGILSTRQGVSSFSSCASIVYSYCVGSL